MEKIIKVKCDGCKKEISCPEGIKKHICYECYKKVDENTDMEETYIDIPDDKMEEMMPEIITKQLIEDIFPDLWKEREEELNKLSKKDMALEAFGEGAYNAICYMLEMKKEETKKQK